MDNDPMFHFGPRYRMDLEPPLRVSLRIPNSTSAVSPSQEDAFSESTYVKSRGLHIAGSSHNLHDDKDDEESSDSDPFADEQSAVPEEDSNDTSVPKPQPSVRYYECLKNHAASMGGHVLDGCGEFLPCGKDGLDALKCAVCSCHRNFHRKEVEGQYPCNCRRNLNIRWNSSQSTSLLPGLPTPLLGLPASQDICSRGQMTMSISSHETDFRSGSVTQKRRRRTKFSDEQKESMMDFADRLGWRLQKHDDDVVQAFCDQVGVPRDVFKVWMHNHKNSLAKRMNDDESELFSVYDSPTE